MSTYKQWSVACSIFHQHSPVQWWLQSAPMLDSLTLLRLSRSAWKQQQLFEFGNGTWTKLMAAMYIFKHDKDAIPVKLLCLREGVDFLCLEWCQVNNHAPCKRLSTSEIIQSLHKLLMLYPPFQNFKAGLTLYISKGSYRLTSGRRDTSDIFLNSSMEAEVSSARLLSPFS